MRLDKFLLLKFGLRSRTYAENLILSGRVTVAGKTELRPAFDIDEDHPAEVEVIRDEDYASLGAYKLERALDGFSLSVEGLDAADIGCSNGGFTDLLLRRGARSVLAVDVGECALPERLLGDRRVTFLRANARDLGGVAPVGFLTADLSFISLTLVLPSLRSVIAPGGKAVVLVKPQFELGKSALDKRGVVKTEKLALSALHAVKDAAMRAGFLVLGSLPSPRRSEKMNREYLLLLAVPENA